MPDMRHNLFNPNQCRTFKAKVQDNPYHEDCPIYIEIPDGELAACLKSVGTVMLLDNWFSTQYEIDSYSHIDLTSHQHCNPHRIEFPQTEYSVQEEVERQNFLKVPICFFG